MALTPQGMAQEMEAQLQLLWNKRYGHALTGRDREQRELLFLAIARGVLKYLKDQETDSNHLFSQIEFSYDGWSWTNNVENLKWNVDIPDIE
jgi:hypothetical protein